MANPTAQDVVLTTEQESLLIETGRSLSQKRRWRGPLVGVALALGAVTALAVRKAVTPCQTLIPLDGDALMSMAQVHTTEMSGMLVNQDPDAVKDWLLQHSHVQNVEDKEQLQENYRAISEAMNTKDLEKAKTIVNQAFGRSLKRWDAKRQDLKSYLKSHSRSLKGLPKLWKALKPPKTKSSSATTAECVFNVEQATVQVAALASNIADSARTCTEDAKFKETSGKVCAVNLAGIAYSISTIAASLSLAAENCASTLLPNFDAMCAGAATGIAAALSQFAGSAALTSAACAPKEFGAPFGVTPSNFGTPGTPGANVRRLHEPQNTTAHARRLVFGGGKGSDMTQCVVDTTSVSWWLAQAGLAINAAANPKDGASCKMPLITKGKYYQYSQMVCAVDILGAINGFGQAIYYLQLAATHCSDQLNMQAMCGAGIDGMVSSLAGAGAGGIAAFLNCWEAQGWEYKIKRSDALATIRKVVMTTKVNGLKQEGNFGRRLEAEDKDIEALKQRFSSPEAAWKSIGFDMEDPNAAFRSARAEVDPQELVSLVGEKDTTKERAEDGGLLGGSHMCS